VLDSDIVAAALFVDHADLTDAQRADEDAERHRAQGNDNQARDDVLERFAREQRPALLAERRQIQHVPRHFFAVLVHWFIPV
jgi:hypothetical protein